MTQIINMNNKNNKNNNKNNRNIFKFDIKFIYLLVIIFFIIFIYIFRIHIYYVFIIILNYKNKICCNKKFTINNSLSTDDTIVDNSYNNNSNLYKIDTSIIDVKDIVKVQIKNNDDNIYPRSKNNHICFDINDKTSYQKYINDLDKNFGDILYNNNEDRISISCFNDMLDYAQFCDYDICLRMENWGYTSNNPCIILTYNNDDNNNNIPSFFVAIIPPFSLLSKNYLNMSCEIVYDNSGITKENFTNYENNEITKGKFYYITSYNFTVQIDGKCHEL